MVSLLNLLPTTLLLATANYHALYTTSTAAAFVPPVTKKTTIRSKARLLNLHRKTSSTASTFFFPFSSPRLSMISKKKYSDLTDMYFDGCCAYLNGTNLRQYWHFQHCDRQRHKTLLSMTNNNENEGDVDSSSSSQSRPISTARVGGRRSSISKSPKKNDNDKFGILKAILPILALLWLLQSLFSGLFFGGGGGSDYVYYQSSTFESRTIGSDGKIETSRKESVRTNMPSLLKSGDSSTSSSVILRGERDEAFERELERDIEREIDSAMRVMQRSILDDFF